MKQVGLKVSEARIGLETNSPHLIDQDKFFWLDTNFYSVVAIPFEEGRDSSLEIIDRTGSPNMEVEEDLLRLSGPFSKLEEETHDRRFSLFGNLGIFSSWILRTLEEKHGIFTFHACALVKEEKVLIVLGGAGSGKTVFILSGLLKGWRLFSSEFVHFRVKGEVEFFKGPVKDAVRVETLTDHFPWVVDELMVNIEDKVGGKTLVDLSSYQTTSNRLTNPGVVIVIPHVEEKRQRVICREAEDRDYLLRKLFHNASAKIGKSTLLYREFAISGVDSSPLVQKRKETIRNFLKSGVIKKSLIWISGVKDVADYFR